MNQKFTQNCLPVFRNGLVMILAFLFMLGKTSAQTYTNGNLSTGATAANGTTAPAGYTYSQLQLDAQSFGFSANPTNNLSLADDFTVPEGQSWNISSMTFYAYSTNYAGTTSPFSVVRVKIYNTNPSVGNPTAIWGDLTTNLFDSSKNAFMYRIGATPDNNRRIWWIRANTPVSLGPGHYWIEYQIGTTNPAASNFLPPSTIPGAVTQPGYNAMQHDVAANVWAPVLDGTYAMDMPFMVKYSTCTPPTITISASANCIPATLTASGATSYTWSPANGLSSTTGATVTANPVGTTTYTVTGTSNGCVGTASITLTNPFTSAVLAGIAPSEVIMSESFNDSLPTGWLSINNSDIIGPLQNWSPGAPSVFPSHSGAPGAYILANYQMTDGETISSWMLTAPVTIQNGDKISFWTRTTDGTYPDRLELRMSTAGSSSNVGSTPTSVGDFTTLLLTVNPNLLDGDAYPSEWTEFSATISGLSAPVTGRFGFRYWVENAGPLGDNSDLIGIDDVLFTRPLSCVNPGSTQNIFVNITGGAAPYTVVYSDGTNNITVPNYQNGALIPVTPSGTTTYTLVSVASAGGCTGSNISGSYTFSAGGATITQQPAATTPICGTGPATISVVASGSNLSYQWYVSTDGGTTFTEIPNGGNYSGTTTATLTISNITPAMNNYVYHVDVSGGDCPGFVTSSNSTLTVAANVVITSQPVNNFVCAGESAPFSVVSNGTTFMWQVSTDGGATFTDMPNDVTPTLVVPGLIENNGNIYRVVVGNGCGNNVTSSTATLTVNTDPVVTTQPAEIVSICGTTPTSITAVVSGTNNTYQWQVSTDGGATFTQVSNGALYSGANTNTLNILTPSASMNGYVYQLIVSGSCGNTSTNNSTLLVSGDVVITSQPSNITVCEGETATFNVVANGATYQWQVSTDGGATFTNISGEITSSLTVVGAASSSNNVYRVVIGNGCGNNINSNNATLTVNPAVVIATQPAATVSVCGTTATSISATVNNATSYQWQVSTDGGQTFNNVVDGALYSGATTTTLNILTPSSSMNGYVYNLVASSNCGSVTSTNSTLSVADATVITTQPADASVCTGQTATFNVVSNGSTVQWQVSTDGGATFTDIAGATSATYTTAATTASMNNYIYRVVVGGCSGTVTSNNATLGVGEAPAITTQPAATVSVCGTTATSITATVTGTGTYQWQVSTDGGTTFGNVSDGATYSGATTTTLNILTPSSSMNGYVYNLVVSSGCGNLTSTNSTLSVSDATAITTQPANYSACEGETAEFSVASNGSTFQWQLSTDGGATFTDIAGATSATYTTAAATASMNNYVYRVVVGGCSGTITSNNATLGVGQPPVINTQPSSATVCEGQASTLTVVSGGQNLTYQWQVSTDGGTTFTDVTGANQSTLDVPGTAGSNSIYRVIVSNACGSSTTSNTATVTVNAATAITTQPVAATTCEGANATFSVTATGSNVTYQWSVTDGSGNTTPISDATSATVNITGVTAAMNGNTYSVVVTGDCGTITSSTAALTVNSTTAPSIEATQSGCEGADITFTATGGSGGSTLQWQVSTDGGATFTDVSGATSSSYTITGLTNGQNNNIYRVVATGACGTVNSNNGVITVNANPTVSITGPTDAVCAGTAVTLTGNGADSYSFDNGITSGVEFTANTTTTYTLTGTTNGCSGTATFTVNVNPAPTVTIAATTTSLNEGQTTTITATASAGVTYQWMKNGIDVPGATSNSITVDYENAGDYTVMVTSGGCSATSNMITIVANPATLSFITPNPNNGKFKVNWRNTPGSTATRTITIFDSKGSMIYLKSFSVNAANPIESMDVDITGWPSGTYHLLLSDGNAKRLKTASFIKK